MEQLVSIIIPLFNRENLIMATLNSIKNQSSDNWECILIDDHSTDNSFESVKKAINNDNRFIIEKRPNDRPKGANACRNYGLEIAKGNYINWFDSDDIMHPDFIFEKRKSFKNLDLDGVISKTAIFADDPTNIKAKETRTKLTKSALEDFLSLKIAWYLPDVMWKKSFFKEKILFDEELMAGQDRDFHARMLLHDPKLVVIDKYLTFYRKHDENITSSIDDLKNARLKISHMHSVDKLINYIDEKGKLTEGIKVTLFNAMIKYLPFTLHNKSDFNILRTILKKLSFFNYSIMIGWLKFYISSLSYKLFGRGSRLLR